MFLSLLWKLQANGFSTIRCEAGFILYMDANNSCEFLVVSLLLHKN